MNLKFRGRKFSRPLSDPRNPRKLSTSKILGYTVVHVVIQSQAHTNIVVLACDDLKWLLSVVDEDLKALQVSLGGCQVGRSVSNLVLAVGINLILDNKLQQENK